MISGLAFTTVVADSGHVLQGFGHIIRVKGNFGAWFLAPLQKFSVLFGFVVGSTGYLVAGWFLLGRLIATDTGRSEGRRGNQRTLCQIF